MSSLEASKLFSVTGMVFVITGGGSGLGEMMAEALAVNGAGKVFILGRRRASLEKVAAKALDTIIPIVCDTSSKSSLAAAAEAIGQETPFVNAVVANAGFLGPVTNSDGPRSTSTSLADFQAQLWATSLEENVSVMDVNVLGSFYTFLAFLPLLSLGNTHPRSPSAAGYAKSQFITTTSFAGLSRAENVSHAYASSKAALLHLSKMLATSFAGYGIRVNSIAPGLYITEMTEPVAQGKDLSVPGSMPKEAIPATRTGNAEDMAGAILFLSSRAGGFVNGNILITDGGMLSISPGSY